MAKKKTPILPDTPSIPKQVSVTLPFTVPAEIASRLDALFRGSMLFAQAHAALDGIEAQSGYELECKEARDGLNAALGLFTCMTEDAIRGVFDSRKGES